MLTNLVERNLTLHEIGALIVLLSWDSVCDGVKDYWQNDRTFTMSVNSLLQNGIIKKEENAITFPFLKSQDSES